MCESVKKRRHINWPRQVFSEPRENKLEVLKKRSNIVAKFLPKGWRFLRPREEVERNDFFWSHINKCYLPATKKRGQLAGIAIPFIRRIEE
jgi:hypothetical protein